MTRAVIESRGLTKRFGSRRGITDVDLRVEQGEVYGFLGPNGAGKTTTIRILMGLAHPTGGSARLFGHDPLRAPVEVHRRTGYLPGDLALHPALTGKDVLDMFGSVRELTDTAYRDSLVERFAAELDRPIKALSKGNRQKIGIVAAFMHRPELLVLDEPTSGLDPLLQEEFTTLLRETADEGRTVLLSSHDLAEVQRVVHRLSIIREGRILVTDTVEGLRAHSPRTIDVTFEAAVPPSRFEGMAGVTASSLGAGRLRLVVSGPVAPALRAVAGLDPVDLQARPADLEELFLGYYREPGEEDSHVA
jgi:ABC-2 type transport system ATP-binding protein